MNATPLDIVEHLRTKGHLTKELATLLDDPVDVEINKRIRKKDVKTDEGDASIEVTGAREL